MYGTQCGAAGGEAREKRMVWKKKEAYWKRHRLELHDAFGTISTSTKTNEQPSSHPNSPLAANKHAGWQPTKPASSKKDPILLEFLLERWRRRERRASQMAAAACFDCSSWFLVDFRFAQLDAYSMF